MKLMKRLLKKNNRGLSLVELICAIAILGLATSAIGGAMVVSAKHYRRDSAEFEVQQEAQTTTNLVGDLIVDSTYAEWVPGDDKLKITNNGINYEIYMDDTTLKYFDGTNTGVLAEYVEDFEVVVPTDFEKDKNVKVNLSIKKDEKEYKASYNTTSRNGDLSNINDEELTVWLSVDENWVIEPNQELRFEVNAMNVNDVSEVGGLTVNTAGVPTGWSVTMSGNDVVVKAPDDASGYITFDVATVDTVAGNPIAHKEIRVDVRRVTGVQLIEPALISGVATKANAEYKVVANVYGSNLLKGDPHYDEGVYEYVNPYCVDFSVSMTGLPEGAVETDYYEVPAANKIEDNVEHPEMIIRLKQDMPEGSTITINGIAKHPEGLWTDVAAANSYNKASKGGVDVPYGIRREHAVHIICVDDPFVTADHGLLRGDDFFFNGERGLNAQLNLIATQRGISPGTLEADWFYRFAETGQAMSHYIRMVQDGEEDKINALETLVFHPDKAYEFDIIMVIYEKNTKKVVWPCDDNLLAPGTGFSESGFSKGWDADDGVNSFNDYGGHFPLDKVKINFKPMSELGVSAETMMIGNASSSGIKVVSVPQSAFTVEFTPTSMKPLTYHYRFKFFELDAYGNETEVSSIPGVNVQVDNEPRLTFQNNAYGRYKLGMVMTNSQFKNLNSNPYDIMNPTFTTVATDNNLGQSIQLYDDTQGCMFLQFNGTP